MTTRARRLAVSFGTVVAATVAWRGRRPVGVLLGALVALTPLAFASPPDPTWIGGFYDDADYDDVVLAASSAAGAAQSARLVLVAPLANGAGVVPPAGLPWIPGGAAAAFQIRAPPIS